MCCGIVSNLKGDIQSTRLDLPGHGLSRSLHIGDAHGHL
jgi:hypothetical protein